MMNRLMLLKRLPLKETMRRVDRIAADMNVLLVVIAIGLATLDVTFLISKKVVDYLPPVTRVSHDAELPSGK
jgi:hypothetical protein